MFTKFFRGFVTTLIVFSLSGLPVFAQIGGVTQTVMSVVTPLADTTAPVISGLANLSLGLGETTIIWNTDELSVSHLEYGTTQNYGTQATLDVSALLVHTAILTGLSSGTTYYYCVHATDLAGNTANSCGHSFITSSPPPIEETISTSEVATPTGGAGADTQTATSTIETPATELQTAIDATPPSISSVSVSNVTMVSAAFAWTTDEVANGEIEYGSTENYGNTTTFNADLSTIHTALIIDLQPGMTYHYRIRASDELGNVIYTPDETFTTASLSSFENLNTQTNVNLGETNVAANVSVDLLNIEVSAIATTSATITWTTDVLSDTQIEYGVSENFGQTSTLDSTLTTNHSVTLANLSPDTNYIFRVKSKPAGVNVATTISSNHQFNTLELAMPVISPANISLVSLSNVTQTGATISWTTDKNTTAQVEYGINTEYGQFSVVHLSPETSHTITLANLVPNTTYHFRALAVDADANITLSQDYTFTTSAPLGIQSEPPAVANLSSASSDAHSVTLSWNVGSADVDATAIYDVRYSTSPITESNFVSATEAQILPIYFADLSPNGVSRTRTHIVAGLNPSTTYYFALRLKYENTNYSPVSNNISVTTSAHTDTDTTIDPPTLITAQSSDSQITIGFHNPDEPGFVETIIVENDNHYPANPTDGTIVYEGRGQTYTDTNVPNGETRYYALYSQNELKEDSPLIRISTAPVSGTRQIVFNQSGTISNFLPVEHFTRTFQKGTQDIEVEHLQEILSNDDGVYPEKIISGYFGDLTQRAILKFQSEHGLPGTGIVDAPTQKKLNTMSHAEGKLNVPEDYVIFQSDLQQGDKGEVVATLQQFLVYEGSYPEAQVTGYFGDLTTKAVKRFQEKHKINSTGYVGEKTRHKIKQVTRL